MSRRARHHDKLLREYLLVRRARGTAESGGGSAARIERLAVRERTLAASLRWIRVELDLPEHFDHDAEAQRLGVDDPRHSRPRIPLRRTKPSPEPFLERQRVKPVPAWLRATERTPPESFDLETALVVHAAKHCARTAAEELLEHRAAMVAADLVSGGDEKVLLTSWPERPLDRTPNGEIYAGSAGRLMGELVVRADDGDAELERARIGVRCYIDEFTGCVTAALDDERAAAAAHRESADEPFDDAAAFGVLLQRELAKAACARIAVEARAARAGTGTSAHDVAALGNSDTEFAELPASATAVTAEVAAVRPAGDARRPLRLLRHG